jgi:hypothetical protein
LKKVMITTQIAALAAVARAIGARGVERVGAVLLPVSLVRSTALHELFFSRKTKKPRDRVFTTYV